MTNSERNGPRPEKSTIEPLGGWSPHALDGLLKKSGASADDRLEVLSVLFAWMMRELELPSKLAVNKICNALAAGTELYLLNDGDYAEVLPANHSFEYFPFVNLNEPERKPSDENVGLAGAIKHLREYWSDSRAFGASKSMGEHVLDPLAVRLSDADRLWGYCRRGDVVAQKAVTGSVPTVKVTKESAKERNRRRYQMCLDAGLDMPDDDYAHLPDGIKDVAAKERISRQAFNKSVKAHIAGFKR